MEFTDVIDALVLVSSLILAAMMYFLIKRGTLKPHMWAWALAISTALLALPLIVSSIVTTPPGKVFDVTSCLPFVGGIIAAYITGRIMERFGTRR